LLGADGLRGPVFPPDPPVPVIDSEASGDAVSQGFGARADIIVVKPSMLEGDDRNASNHAAFAASLNFRAFDQCLYRIWFSLGIANSTKITVALNE
jgi:hypothetical protein